MFQIVLKSQTLGFKKFNNLKNKKHEETYMKTHHSPIAQNQ